MTITILGRACKAPNQAPLSPTLVTTLKFKVCEPISLNYPAYKDEHSANYLPAKSMVESRFARFMVTIKKLMAPKIMWSINRVLFPMKIGERFQSHRKKTKTFRCEII